MIVETTYGKVDGLAANTAVTGILVMSRAQSTHTSVDRLASMAELKPRLGKMHFNLVFDGGFLKERRIHGIRNAAASQADIMVGTPLDDARIGLGADQHYWWGRQSDTAFGIMWGPGNAGGATVLHFPT